MRLTLHALEALNKHKAAKNAERLKLGELWQDKCLVFCTMVGKPLDFRTVATASSKLLLRKVGLPDIRFHYIWLTCATLFLSRGHHPSWFRSSWGLRRRSGRRSGLRGWKTKAHKAYLTFSSILAAAQYGGICSRRAQVAEVSGERR